MSAPAGTPATTPAPVPTDIANGTNTRCAIYYRVSPGDDCSRITVNLTVFELLATSSRIQTMEESLAEIV